MSRSNVSCRVVERIHRITGVTVELDEPIVLDSLEMLELMFDLEEVFSMRFKEEDVANIKTVGDLVDYLS